MNEDSNSQYLGFLHISDLVKLQQLDPLFTTPDKGVKDIESQMEEQIQNEEGVAFDLRLGSQYYLSGEDYPSRLQEEGVLNIQPGQFALLTTYEIFHMPLDLVAFISMRFRIKAEGLINVSGFQVDPGYQGVFIFSVYNAGTKPVPLQFKSKIFTAIFAKTSKPISKKRIEVNEISIEKWSKLMQKKNISLIGLDDRVSELEKSLMRAKYAVGITLAGIAAVGTIITVILNI